MNALVPIQNSNAEVYRASTDAAGLCREIVVKTAKNIQGRKYVCVEGWQAIAIAHGCTASADGVERVEDEGMSGFRAFGIVRRMSDGAEIARAEGFLGDDEQVWTKRPVYARRAMVQTRAISRACRSAFAHVVVMIDGGLSTTPAEEVPDGGFEDRGHDAPAPRQALPKADHPATISDDQRDIIQGLADAAGITLQVICESYKIKSLRDLPAHKFEKLAHRLREDAKARTPAPAGRGNNTDDGMILDDAIPF